MRLDPGEVQIVKGPGLTVTDKRIVSTEGEIAVGSVTAPQIEDSTVEVSAAPTLLAIGGLLATGGFFLMAPIAWIPGIAIMAFGVAAKVKRHGFSLTIETNGARKPIYT